MEQTALYNLPVNSGACWGNNTHNKTVKVLQCPSDPTYGAGINTNGGNGGSWAVTSYAPLYQLFGTASRTNGYGTTVTQCAPQYGIATIVDGTSNQVGVVERYSMFPAYGGWANCILYPSSGNNWGYTNAASSFGYWQAPISSLPQLGAKASGTNAAHPYYPNTAHSTMQTLMMDGAVRGVGTVSANTWSQVCTPDDGVPLGTDW